MEEEIWKDIAGYEGLYQVSDFGDVRSLGRWRGNGKGGFFQEGRILKLGKTTDGYPQIQLFKDGEMKSYKIHRLVAQAFIENPNNLPCVNHIDEDKTNNRASNLEWCTRAYNNNYGTRSQRIAEALRGVYNNPKRSKKVLQLTLDGKIVREWPSVMECHRNGFNEGVVAACCRCEYGLRKNVYKGYRWVYAEDYYKKVA